jgi:endonuclease/exonuclease/phosphatase family metal-dependent hydrolase
LLISETRRYAFMPALTVMTFNVRYDEPADGRHGWLHRRDAAIALIRSHDPDLLGLQEPMAAQWQDLSTALPEWSPFGAVPEDEGCFDPQGGFVRTARFQVLETGLFWLSETPQVAGSVSWPNDWGPRACGWARLHDRTNRRDLLFACTHFDTNQGAWEPSARVLHTQIDRVAGGLPVILVGDFNCAAGSEAHRYLCRAAGYRDAWNEAGHEDEGVVTFNGFTQATRLPEDQQPLDQWLTVTSGGLEQFAHYGGHVRRHRNYRIDWILVRGSLAAKETTIDYRHDRGLMPSDHYPVISVVDWRE